jgi:hypothetical protein
MVDVALAAREAKAASAQKLTSADEKNDMNVTAEYHSLTIIATL